MAVKREFSYASADGRTKIHGVEWKPEAGEPKAVLQIFHGMVEYIERYEEFASYLTEKILLEADFLVNSYEGQKKSETIEAFCRNVFRTPSGIRLLSLQSGLKLGE